MKLTGGAMMQCSGPYGAEMIVAASTRDVMVAWTKHGTAQLRLGARPPGVEHVPPPDLDLARVAAPALSVSGHGCAPEGHSPALHRRRSRSRPRLRFVGTRYICG